MLRALAKIYYVLSAPIAIFAILNSPRIHPAYGMTWRKKYVLGLRMLINTMRISATSYKTHLVMALKLLEMPPDVPGDVIECGTYYGGSAANLSLVCQIVGRKLLIYDSFEGFPEPDPKGRYAKYFTRGLMAVSLKKVRSNIKRLGAIEACEFVKGWFNETLPKLNSPIVLAWLDVDLEENLETCVQAIWPHLTEDGYIFIDEMLWLDYCALFYSERWWNEHFDRVPPGLIGAGVGLPLGEYYIGPSAIRDDYPLQHANAGAYTQKSMTGYWSYYPSKSG